MRILSGIQSTGQMHVGNFLGAGRQYLDYQSQGDFFLMVADLHALTVPQDPNKFREQTLNKVIELLAIGVDPEKCTLFVQSHIKAHTELTWILNTLTPISELERMTQYKDKAKSHKDNINVGLFDYPVLMAADILLYKTEVVPVGQDQTQHLELARTLAKKFNAKYGETFPEPKTMLAKEGAKIMSLANPKKKMSKSDPVESYIGLTDDPITIEKKITHAVTDAGKEVRYNLAKKPEISNLLLIYSLFSEKSMESSEKKFRGKNYVSFKKALSELLVEKLGPFRKKYQELKNRDLYVEEILKQGERKASSIAAFTMTEVRKKMGLLIF